MTEILTESFCERCGTRYTFESSAPQRSRVGRVRTFSRGVKNFVMSDEASFSEAMADARGEEELATTAHQLDAFHKTFNFCLTCRQYTCGECWNVSEGRCLTCAPMAGLEEPGLAAAATAAPVAVAGNGHVHEDVQPDIWPEADLSQDRLARALGAEAVADAPVAEPAAEDEIPSQHEVDAASRAFDIPLSDDFLVEDDLDHALTVDEAWREAAAALDAEAAEAAAASARSAAEEPAFVEPEAVLADEPSFVEPEAILAEPPQETALVEDDLFVDAAGAGMAASTSEDEAELEAQASAAEQDATAEAVMDPALDFDEDETQGVSGVAPGQSLEEAIAAYEARLAAEEAEATSTDVAEPAIEVAAAAAIVEPDVEIQPVTAEVEPVEAAIEPVASRARRAGRAGREPEPVAASPEPEPVVAEALAAAVVVDAVAEAHEDAAARRRERGPRGRGRRPSRAGRHGRCRDRGGAPP